MKWKWIERTVFIVILAGCALWICRQQHVINGLRIDGSHLTDKIDADIAAHRRLSDSINVLNRTHRDSIAALSVKIDSLQHVKQQIKIRYEKEKNDLYNPAVVDGDSVYRYILRSINAK
jgi:hypothetical protein